MAIVKISELGKSLVLLDQIVLLFLMVLTCMIPSHDRKMAAVVQNITHAQNTKGGEKDFLFPQIS